MVGCRAIADHVRAMVHFHDCMRTLKMGIHLSTSAILVYHIVYVDTCLATNGHIGSGLAGCSKMYSANVTFYNPI